MSEEIDLISDVVNPVVDNIYDDDDGVSVPVNGLYQAPTPVHAVIDTTTNKVSVVDVAPPTEFEIMKAQADQMGFKLNDSPKKNCSKCYGRGFTAKDAKTKQPIPCKCIFPKMTLEEKLKNDDLSKKLEMSNLSRDGKRKMGKFLLKNADAILTNMEEKISKDEFADE